MLEHVVWEGVFDNAHSGVPESADATETANRAASNAVRTINSRTDGFMRFSSNLIKALRPKI